MTPAPHGGPTLFIEGAGRRHLTTLINDIEKNTDYHLLALIFTRPDYDMVIQTYGKQIEDNEIFASTWSVKLYSTDDPEAEHICATSGVPYALVEKEDEQIEMPFAYFFLNTGWKFDEIWEFVIGLSEFKEIQERLQFFYQKRFKQFRRQRGKPEHYWLSIIRHGVQANTETAKGFRKYVIEGELNRIEGEMP
jgi:hypothetical protein